MTDPGGDGRGAERPGDDAWPTPAIRRNRRLAGGVAAALLVVGGTGAIVWGDVLGEPVAESRADDACAAESPTGIAGLDLETGAVRWTNVIGPEPVGLWPTRDGGDGHRVDIRDADGTIRTVDRRTGDVAACRSIDDPDPLPYPEPRAVDDTGALPRLAAPRTVQVVEPDGSVRWSVPDRNLLGGTPTAVVAEVAIPGACCDESSARLAFEGLDPSTGERMWAIEVLGFEGVVTDDHLLVLDQSGGTGTMPRPTDEDHADRASVVAYSLADGTEAWRVDLDTMIFDLAADDGRVVLSHGAETVRTDDTGLALVDETTGELVWSVNDVNPGRGGEFTEGGALLGAEVGDGLVVVAIQAQAPYRD